LYGVDHQAQQHRTQEVNRFDDMVRPHKLVNSAALQPKTRRATKPSKGSKQRLRVANTGRSPKPHEPHQKVGKQPFNFTERSHSTPVKTLH
jgi:hypothetical protein